MNFEAISRELLRALRGDRLQREWSQTLGYRSNVAYHWEAGRQWPTAAVTLAAVRAAGVDPIDAVQRFYGVRPGWFDEIHPDTPAGIARLLDDLRGDAGVGDLARRAGVSRFAAMRWLSGRAQPRLPEFLGMVHAASLRVVDFVATLVEPTQIPTIAPHWKRMEARRQGANQHPWTQAVLRALELDEYRALAVHETSWLARRLGIELAVAATCIDFMQDTRQVRWTGTHFQQHTVVVDTRHHPEISRRLKQHWTEVAADRISVEASGPFFNHVFTCTREEFEQIRQLHLKYYREVRAIVAESKPLESVAVVNVQLFELQTSSTDVDGP